MTHTPSKQRDEIALELCRCVMVVDKTASATEKAHTHTMLCEGGPNGTTAEVNERIMISFHAPMPRDSDPPSIMLVTKRPYCR